MCKLRSERSLRLLLLTPVCSPKLTVSCNPKGQIPSLWLGCKRLPVKQPQNPGSQLRKLVHPRMPLHADRVVVEGNSAQARKSLRWCLQRRTARMIRKLRSLGYKIAAPNPQPSLGLLGDGRAALLVTNSVMQDQPDQPTLFQGAHFKDHYPVDSVFFAAGAESVPRVTLKGRGMSSLHWGRQRRPIIRSITHAPDQTGRRRQLAHCDSDLAAPSRCSPNSKAFS